MATTTTHSILHQPNWAQLRDAHKQNLLASVAEQLDTVNRQISSHIEDKEVDFELSSGATDAEARIILRYLKESVGDWLTVSYHRRLASGGGDFAIFKFDVEFANNTLLTDAVQHLKMAKTFPKPGPVFPPIATTTVTETVSTGYTQAL